MGHRLGAGPVRIVLVPGDDAAMLGRLAEELIVPEADRPAEQLAGRHGERRVPEDVVKAGSNSPRAQGVKQHRVGLARFVGVVLVPQLVAGMLGLEELGQLAAQLVDLLVGEDPHAGQIAVLVVEGDLLVGQAVAVPLGLGLGKRNEVADEFVARGEVSRHRRLRGLVQELPLPMLT